MAKTKTPVIDLEQDEDGWIGGGASQSIYAPKPNANPTSHMSPPPAPKATTAKPSPKTPARDKSSRSLRGRMDMAQTPPPKSRNANHNSAAEASPSSITTPSLSNQQESTSPFRTTPSQGIRRPSAKIPSPLPLTSPARNNGPVSPLNTRTPLSASHPIPETPLKLSQRGGPQTPATPHYPIYPRHSHSNSQDDDAARASGLGLGLTPLKQSVPLAPSPNNVRSALDDALHLRGRAASNASIGSPLKSGRSDLHGEPLALGSSQGGGGNGQIDSMLDLLRNARSGLGTSASMWAPKPAPSHNSANTSSSSSNTSHTIGSGFSASNLLGMQTGLDRQRPSHRPNGLQLSLGQEISVMQELAEGAEEEYPTSKVSFATLGKTFKIDPPADGDQDGWQGTVVPPTPSLGCDSPDSEDGAKAAPSRSLDAFGWGNSEPRKSSLFSKLPSSSTLETNWSGDDDDDRKDDVEVFEDIQRAARTSKDKRHSPLPPPSSIKYGKSRTPSPTHLGLLAKSPQLEEKGRTSPLPTPAGVEGGMKRLSPASGRLQLSLTRDSDGDDADVETENLFSEGRERKGKAQEGADSLQVNAGGLEKKCSLKRDKSERIRGRRASQSKEKDVKLTTTNPVQDSATVLLPTSNFASKSGGEDLVQSIEKVSLNDEAKPQLAAIASKTETPVAQRVQTIPTVKDDLFSSPAEPKDDLLCTEVKAEEPTPPTSTSATPAPAEPSQHKETNKEAKEEEMKKDEEKPPEPTSRKQMSFDWAADDELGDELPDLDDWGVTLTPVKPITSCAAHSETESVPKTSTQNQNKGGGRNGKSKPEEGVWRRGGILDAPPKGKASGDRKSSGKTGRVGSKTRAGAGIRIAGRAKCDSLFPEPESVAPPASTPYGRWKTTLSNTVAKEDQGLSIKGIASTNRKPATTRSIKDVRPRIAADRGALTKLIAPDAGQPQQPKVGGGERGSRKNSPAVDKGAEWKKGASVKDSTHAPSSGASTRKRGGFGAKK
ncbi:hypothetical protein NDA18_001337 [Ustilago nuda]|nr:hypothetical protein NDA18_001337 [Ustilago nuda]